MKTRKFLMVNIASIAIVILAYRLLPLERIVYSLTPGISSIIYFIIDFVFITVFYFILILALEKDKHLLSKPLFEKSQNFMKRFSVVKLVVLVLLEFVYNMIVQELSNISVSFDINALKILIPIISLLHLVIVYYIIVGKENYLFKAGKYAVAATIIAILAYGASTAADIVCGQIIAEKVALSLSSENMDIFEILNALDDTDIYSKIMSLSKAIAEIAAFGSIIVFHKLSRERILSNAS